MRMILLVAVLGGCFDGDDISPPDAQTDATVVDVGPDATIDAIPVDACTPTPEAYEGPCCEAILSSCPSPTAACVIPDGAACIMVRCEGIDYRTCNP